MTYLTEAEAREQVCPFIRVMRPQEVAEQMLRDGAFLSRTTLVSGHQNCQASACKMGWRWGFGERGIRGYCGACGKPA